MKNNKKNKSIIILDMVFYEDEKPKQETEHLLSTETNKKRLLEDVSKQETLEEARANSYINFAKSNEDVSAYSFVAGWDKGVKWQQEQDKNKYSEEEVLSILEDYDREFKLNTFAYTAPCRFTVREWFEKKTKL